MIKNNHNVKIRDQWNHYFVLINTNTYDVVKKVVKKAINKLTLHNLPGTKHLNSVYSMSVAAVVKRHFGLTPPMRWLKCHMMSQFVYLEVITAADMFHICLHPDLLDAFNSGLCPVVPRDEMECDNRAGKKTDQLLESLRFRRIARCRGSAFLCATEEAQPVLENWLHVLLPDPQCPPHAFLQACMHVCTYQGIALSISPSGLQGFAPTQSLYAHMHCRGDLVDSVVLLCLRHLPLCFYKLYFSLSIQFFNSKHM